MFQSVGVNINKDLKNVLRAKKVPFRKSFMERPHLELEYFKGRNKNASENTMDHLYDMMKSKKDNMMNSMKKMYDKNFSKQEEPMKEIPKLFTKKNNATLFALGTIASAVVVSSLISKSHSHKHRFRF
ncbi:hypothetical protein [Clostridium cellulovorans]|uniref:Uncharacterized protein n=1 Tax=Clostridium cellulovorans (strain ATCC 35296 / DSM 3052 / OCM 3 / 743B) TaxID=573061 RepID=D9SL10_CLOC7|nr:hypothetical protein [Clostridium cellulovorans]ADL53582.1 hypothetical protein Clocel_3916 [Clostridium cellulovorans 743B]